MDEFRVAFGGPLCPAFPNEHSVCVTCIGVDFHSELRLSLSGMTYGHVRPGAWKEVRRVLDNACQELRMLEDAMSFEIKRFGSDARVLVAFDVDSADVVNFHLPHDLPKDVEEHFRPSVLRTVRKAEERMGIVCGVQILIERATADTCVAVENSNYRPHEEQWRSGAG